MGRSGYDVAACDFESKQAAKIANVTTTADQTRLEIFKGRLPMSFVS
jgi:hypothetical protein